MNEADEKQIKKWINDEIKHAIYMERWRVKDEQIKKSSQRLNYVIAALTTSVVWFLISLIIWAKATS